MIQPTTPCSSRDIFLSRLKRLSPFVTAALKLWHTPSRTILIDIPDSQTSLSNGLWRNINITALDYIRYILDELHSQGVADVDVAVIAANRTQEGLVWCHLEHIARERKRERRRGMVESGAGGEGEKGARGGNEVGQRQGRCTRVYTFGDCKGRSDVAVFDATGIEDLDDARGLREVVRGPREGLVVVVDLERMKRREGFERSLLEEVLVWCGREEGGLVVRVEESDFPEGYRGETEMVLRLLTGQGWLDGTPYKVGSHVRDDEGRG
ncbi:Hypothetical protein D9617_7g030350 [Elsinoe fawcettii]|nr:Hypothetical protein D9617_7g030350 [Elsinoe fawcettii]